MWPGRAAERTVTCIACGETLSRADAREYDKHGDRWSREQKRFEYLCKPCFRELSKGSREGLEECLAAAGAGETDRGAFLARYLDLARSDAGTDREGSERHD
jgi:hypothetical protein